MTDEQYKYFEQLVNERKVEEIRKHKTDKITDYIFIVKTNEKNVKNKYRATIANTDERLLNKIDNLIIQNKIIKKESRINKLSIAAGVVAGFIVVGSLVGIAQKERKTSFSIENEVQMRREQIFNQTGKTPVGNELKEIYNDVYNERKNALDDYDKKIDEKRQEIEELKKAKQELEKSYYETSNESAKSI